MDKITELLTRGVDKIYPSKEAFEKVLRSGKKLRLYLGIDPTGNKLHLGHMVALRKLRQFQDLGHHVIFMHGDFTAMIGDPTDKTAARQKLTHEQVMSNAKDYKKDAAKIITFNGPNPIETTFNNTWLSKLTFADVVELASNFSAQQMLERDMFQQRIKAEKPIYLHEFLYPLMQGYDTVAQNVDLEIGGSDQTFNMMAGRTLMKALKNKEKFVLTMQLLAEPNQTKMSKSEGNLIALAEAPNEMYGQIMTWSDQMILPGFTLLSNLPMEEVERIKRDIESGKNPMIYKKQLAFTLTEMLNSEQAAAAAQQYFETTFQKREITGEIPTAKINSIKTITVIDLLTDLKLAVSRGEAKRLTVEGAVEIDGIKFSDPQQKIQFKNGMIVKVGKHRFIKLKV